MPDLTNGMVMDVNATNQPVLRQDTNVELADNQRYPDPPFYLKIRAPFAHDVTLGIYCSSEAKSKLLDDLGIDYCIKAIIEQVRAAHKTWQPLCYVSRSPDDEQERLILKFESGLPDFAQKYKAWKEICDWTVGLCKELAARYQLGDWQDLYSKFSVVVW